MNVMWSFDNEHAQEYVRVRQDFIREFLESVRSQVTLETAIDVGCGVGYMSKFLSDLGLLVVAIEGREENTLEARRRYPEITFLTRNVEDPSLSEFGVFDLTLCVGLLYHLENPFRAIRNLYSLTGKLVIVESMCTPGKDPEMILLDEGRENNQGLSYVAFYPTEICLITMLERAGFPFVYRFRRAPEDEQFKSTLMRKRWRTILAASKVELKTESLVPAAELEKRRYTAPNPWGTVLSNSRNFCYAKILSAKNRLVRIMGSAREVPGPGRPDGNG